MTDISPRNQGRLGDKNCHEKRICANNNMRIDITNLIAVITSVYDNRCSEDVHLIRTPDISRQSGFTLRHIITKCKIILAITISAIISTVTMSRINLISIVIMSHNTFKITDLNDGEEKERDSKLSS